MVDQPVPPEAPMDDLGLSNRRIPLSQRIHEMYTTLCADLVRSPPTFPLDLPPDDPLPTQDTIRRLVRQMSRRGLRSSNSRRITELFVLG